MLISQTKEFCVKAFCVTRGAIFEKVERGKRNMEAHFSPGRMGVGTSTVGYGAFPGLIYKLLDPNQGMKPKKKKKKKRKKKKKK